MATYASTLADSALATMLDAAGDLFTESDMVKWLNQGIVATAMLVPRSSSEIKVFQLTQGVAQTVPNPYVSIVDVVANMGADGATRGDAIRTIDLEVLSRQNPGWGSESASGAVERIIDDERDEGGFSTYPPQPNPGHYIECLLSRVPDSIVSLNDAIPLHDKYCPALVEFLLERMHGGNEESGTNIQAAARHYDAYIQMIGADPKLARAYASKQPDFARGSNPGLA